ncbi:OmpA family protein [Hymenobacter setariae]|uniref:OmpA family protein n=1 Tax=Hymenobacter setariae TaxID=2594794 RepID=A0A558BV28_9BACT|nr:OmpA family protein [Hymenobacter setariae]TVT40323.1 OmpA family protein [Hymenobacter setariae]
MRLDSIVNQYLSDELLTQLAQASVLPRAATEAYCKLALPALVHQLAAPIDASEADARWDMCRQLFLSRLLTDKDELLRTDIGWPDRRRYLAQKILGAAQVSSLTESTAQPAQAVTLLGFLTIMTLAAVGEHAHEADLEPAALSKWLGEQAALVASEVSRPATAPTPAKPKAASAAASPPQPAATPTVSGGKNVKMLSVVGTLLVVALAGGYFLLGTPANATQQETPTTEVAATAATPAPASEPAAAPATEAPATPEVVAPVAASPLVAAPAAAAARPAVAGAVLRDTVGNAALARQIGGKFNVALGRYTKGEGQPLIVKLINRATLTVGINSTESLLYKRLSKTNLPRPNDIVLDRLTFDLGQARLGAEGAQQLGSVASILKTFPKAHLVVVGHANNQEAQAMRLGLQRATVAVDELVKQGISASRLQAQGVLSTELPTDNDSPEKQAMLQGISLKMSRL